MSHELFLYKKNIQKCYRNCLLRYGVLSENKTIEMLSTIVIVWKRSTIQQAHLPKDCHKVLYSLEIVGAQELHFNQWINLSVDSKHYGFLYIKENSSLGVQSGNTHLVPESLFITFCFLSSMRQVPILHHIVFPSDFSWWRNSA